MRPLLNDTHFILLGITRYSKKEEIKKAYRDRIKKWHPDKFTNLPNKYQEALEMCKRINEAFELLKSYVPPNVPDAETNRSASHERTKRRLDITRLYVKSSNLHSVGYDRDLKVLQVEFRSGGVYQYYDVPENIYFELLKAESKGRYLNSQIAFRFRYESV